MTTKELIRTHNELAAQRGLPPLNGWKASKEALQARIDALRPSDPLDVDPLALEVQEPSAEPEPDQVSPNGAEETTDEHRSPEEAPVIPTAGLVPTDAIPEGSEAVDVTKFEAAVRPKGGVGKLVASLLLDPEGFDYGEIVDIVRGEFPEANTSKRSVASVAARLRRDGVDVPMRRAKGSKG